MSRMGRKASAVGIAAALLFGTGVATAGSVAAAPLTSSVAESTASVRPTSSGSDSAASVLPGEWRFRGFYGSYEKCRISGRTSGTQYDCRHDERLDIWRLFLWL